MKKILFFFLLFIFYNNQLIASQNKLNSSNSGCNRALSEEYLYKINKLKIKKIEIDIHNYKKWTINNINIITSGTRFISDELKIEKNS